MITIIVDNRNEYAEMMEYAQEYMCHHISFVDCPGTHQCDKCYEDNHVKCGIRVIPLDSDNPKEL